MYSKPALALFKGTGEGVQEIGEQKNNEKAAYLCEPYIMLLLSKSFVQNPQHSQRFLRGKE